MAMDGSCFSFALLQAKIEPMVGVMSVEALISACQNAARAAPSFGMYLPDFSPAYMRMALDCEMVTFFPLGPSLSTITGIWAFGFIAMNSADLCSPFCRLIGWNV